MYSFCIMQDSVSDSAGVITRDRVEYRKPLSQYPVRYNIHQYSQTAQAVNSAGTLGTWVSDAAAFPSDGSGEYHAAQGDVSAA